MALDGTLTTISKQDLADREQLVLDMQGPSSYTAAGEAVLPSDFPFRTGGVELESVAGNAADAADGFASLDPASAKLRFYDANGVEVAGAVDLSAFTYRLIVLGR